MRLPLKNNHGQNIVEYALVFAIVLIVIIAALSGGFFPKQLSESLNVSMEGIECMAVATCYDPDPHPCPPVCGDGCCQAGEEASCTKDCENLFTP